MHSKNILCTQKGALINLGNLRTILWSRLKKNRVSLPCSHPGKHIVKLKLQSK